MAQTFEVSKGVWLPGSICCVAQKSSTSPLYVGLLA